MIVRRKYSHCTCIILLCKHFPRPGTKYIKNYARFPGPFFLSKPPSPSAALLAMLSAWLFTGFRRNDRLKTPPNTQSLSYREGQGAGRGGWCFFTLPCNQEHCSCIALAQRHCPLQEISSHPSLMIFRSLSLFLVDIKACRNLQGVRSSQNVWYLLELM